MHRISGNLRVILVAVLCACFVGGTGAIAGSLITGKDIKNGSIKKNDLSKKVRTQLNKHADDGRNGTNGTNGTNGQDGADAVVKVQALVPDTTGDGPAPPAWGERVSNGCGSSTGDANVDGNTLEFNLPDAAGNDAVGANFNGYNSLQLKDLSYISYHAQYAQSGTDQHGGTPYFRIFTEDFDHSVMFSPNTQPGAVINSGEWRKWVVTSGGVRYDDDGGNNPDITWNQLIAAHGNDTIAQIRIQAGCAGAYSAHTVAQADDLTVVADGQKAVYDFGQ